MLHKYNTDVPIIKVHSNRLQFNSKMQIHLESKAARQFVAASADVIDRSIDQSINQILCNTPAGQETQIRWWGNKYETTKNKFKQIKLLGHRMPRKEKSC